MTHTMMMMMMMITAVISIKIYTYILPTCTRIRSILARAAQRHPPAKLVAHEAPDALLRVDSQGCFCHVGLRV